jgi:hypothetical protein
LGVAVLINEERHFFFFPWFLDGKQQISSAKGNNIVTITREFQG